MLYNLHLNVMANTTDTSNYSVSFGSQNPTKITASITLGNFLFSPKANKITDIFSLPEIIIMFCLLFILALAVLWFFIPSVAKDYLDKMIDKIVYLTRKKTKTEQREIKAKKLEKQIKAQQERLEKMNEKKNKYQNKLSESNINESELSNNNSKEISASIIEKPQQEQQSIFGNMHKETQQIVQSGISSQSSEDQKIINSNVSSQNNENLFQSNNSQQSAEIINNENIKEQQQQN